MKYYNIYNYKLSDTENSFDCILGIAEDNSALCNIFFEKDLPPKGFEKRETPLIKNAAKQLDEYFKGRRQIFDLPLTFHATTFREKVWKTLQTIPYGQTRSYGEIAAITGNPAASRAVGMANHSNPISIIIPCHRVIGHDGKLTGYAG